MLDGRLDGGYDPEHPVPGPALRVGAQPVQPGLPHHRGLRGHDVELGAVGAVLGPARTETGAATLVVLPVLLRDALCDRALLRLDRLPPLPRWHHGMNCIKIGLPGKLIFSKRKGLREVLFS